MGGKVAACGGSFVDESRALLEGGWACVTQYHGLCLEPYMEL